LVFSFWIRRIVFHFEQLSCKSRATKGIGGLTWLNVMIVQ
jgi:hypothetical protein